MAEKIPKVDVKDKKILRLLQKNSRTPFATIAKKVGLSKEAVQYRFARLQEKQIIKSTYTAVDIEMLGYQRYHILVLLDESNKPGKQKFLKAIMKHPNVMRVVEFSDHWDYNIVVLAKNQRNFYEVMEELLVPYEDVIMQKKTEAVVDRKSYHVFPGILDDNTGEILLEKRKPQPSFDEKDLKILKVLATDARASTYTIAPHVGLNADTVGVRIKKLVKNGIIKRFTCYMNHDVFNYQRYVFRFSMATVSAKDQQQFYYYAAQNKRISLVEYVLGKWDVKVAVVVQRPEEFHQIVKDIKLKFSDVIRKYDTWVVYRDVLFNPFPGVLLK